MTFAVVAIPSRDRSMKEFQELLASIVSEESSTRQIRVVETSRLVDDGDGDRDNNAEVREGGGEGLGDCFLVSLEILPREDDSCTETDDQDLLLSDMSFLDKQAELWVNSDGPLPLAPPYGWKLDTFSCQDSSDTRTICQNLHKFGLAIVKRSSRCHDPIFRKANDKLNEHIQEYESLVRNHHPHIELGVSPFGFREFTHRGPQRFEILLDEHNHKKTYQWLKESLEPLWIDTVCQYLELDRSRIRLGISCVYSRPGSTDQDWHTDGGNYSSDPTKPYAVCIFVPLISLTNETGYTRFWPHSHKHSKHLLGLGQAGEAIQATVDGVGVEPGDYILYHYETWHKGVGNTSKETTRPILQFLYSSEWYKERKNYGEQSIHDYDT